MQRLVILTEAEGIPGPPAVDDPLFSENLVEALGPTVDIAAIRSGRELKVIKNRSGACGMVRLSSNMESLLDGVWQGSLPLAEAGPPLPYSFETFLQWEGNRLAMEAARALSNSKRRCYGDLARLSLLGAPGTGKTHLLSAIWKSVKEQDPGTKVVYFTASKLFDHMTSAIRNMRIREFEDNLADLDMILIDHAEDLARMERTQEMLKKALDAAAEKGTSVVVAWTGDGPPTTGFHQPLVDRLSGFVPIRIARPDGVEGRQFLRALLSQYLGPIQIAERWADWLVTCSRGRVRALQGLVAGLLFECRALGLDFSEESLQGPSDFETRLERVFMELWPEMRQGE
jgi:chromosomal replication initiation ATPase DnaA